MDGYKGYGRLSSNISSSFLKHHLVLQGSSLYYHPLRKADCHTNIPIPKHNL